MFHQFLTTDDRVAPGETSLVATLVYHIESDDKRTIIHSLTKIIQLIWDDSVVLLRNIWSYPPFDVLGIMFTVTLDSDGAILDTNSLVGSICEAWRTASSRTEPLQK